MNNADFEQIEQTLQLTLPTAYRALLTTYPADMEAAKTLHLYDDSAEVVAWNQTARTDPEFMYGEVWPPHQLIIGQDGNGNLFYLDANQVDSEKVYLWHHEGAQGDDTFPNMACWLTHIREQLAEHNAHPQAKRRTSLSWRARFINTIQPLIQLDIRLTHRLMIPPDTPRYHIVRRLAHLGDGWNVVIGLFIFGLIGYYFELTHLFRSCTTTALITLLTAGVVTTIKFIIRRPRPRPPGEFVLYEYDQYSFPSGHSARMACVGSGICYYYPTIGLALLIVALLVALARVFVGVHYLSDILGGLLIGTAVAWGSLLLLFG